MRVESSDAEVNIREFKYFVCVQVMKQLVVYEDRRRSSERSNVVKSCKSWAAWAVDGWVEGKFAGPGVYPRIVEAVENPQASGKREQL